MRLEYENFYKIAKCLNEINNNKVSCYIQKEILKSLKEYIIELSNSNYDNLNYSLKIALGKKE